MPLGVNVSILSATVNNTADAPRHGFRRRLDEEGGNGTAYCLVKVLVQPAINIWVGLPADGTYNGNFQALGGGGYAGDIHAPTEAVKDGYVGAFTDTGHNSAGGSFGMLPDGSGPNVQLQQDFVSSAYLPPMRFVGSTHASTSTDRLLTSPHRGGRLIGRST